jgi:hypothetical protein
MGQATTARVQDEAELADVLSEGGALALRLQVEREELELRLELLDAWTDRLEKAVACLRERAARGQDCGDALDELLAVHTCLRRHLA